MKRMTLQEYRNPSSAAVVVTESVGERGEKNLYMEGIFIEGDVRNENERIYPSTEISRAVKTLQEQINEHGGVLGELDHPADLKINLDRVSHIIVKMWMDGSRGIGKLKVIPTPMGNLVKTMCDAGVKLGVSSRGSGDVDDRTGQVSDFEIVTVDVVAQPSAPNAYPKAIYESLMNHTGGQRLWTQAQEAVQDPHVQRYLEKDLVKFIRDLKL